MLSPDRNTYASDDKSVQKDSMSTANKAVN